MCNVGLIIIGNEILNGQVKDENGVYLAQSLSMLGHRLKRISVIPDEIDIISKEVLKFSQEYDIVITSGGIGTTHDDVTFEAVAVAFDESIHQHPELTARLIKMFHLTGESLTTDSKLKLARIPQFAKLTYGTDIDTGRNIPYPVVSNRNVYIFPGIPSLFRKSFDIIKRCLPGNALQLYTNSLYFSTDESNLTDSLNVVVKEFSDSILFGSYPVLNNNFYKVRIHMETTREELLELAANRLKGLIGEDKLSTYDPFVFTKASEKVYRFISDAKGVHNRIQSALDAIGETLKMFQSHEVVIAFTGGKDCTVIMHLIHAYLQHHYPSNRPIIRVLFVRTRPSFQEVEDFVGKSLKNYGIVPPTSNFIEYNGPIKTNLETLRNEHPEIKAVFMGTRRTDPNGNQTTFSKTTDGWPDFTLINPVLDWSYRETWQFLLDLSVPYCCLYDRGYTSLGGIDNTLPNPELLFLDSNGKHSYHPAHYLKEEAFERIGR